MGDFWVICRRTCRDHMSNRSFRLKPDSLICAIGVIDIPETPKRLTRNAKYLQSFPGFSASSAPPPALETPESGDMTILRLRTNDYCLAGLYAPRWLDADETLLKHVSRGTPLAGCLACLDPDGSPGRGNAFRCFASPFGFEKCFAHLTPARMMPNE